MLRLSLTAVLLCSGCRLIERAAVGFLDDGYAAPSSAGPETIDLDKPALTVAFVEVVDGLAEATDIQFPPGESQFGVVLTKGGTAYVIDTVAKTTREWFRVPVLTVSEQGLLGLAFHPDFGSNGRFFINHSPDGTVTEMTRVSEYRAADLNTEPTLVQHVLDVAQPYQNHNGGQIQFGPDGMLYIGLGDGGLRDDPLGAGQDRSMLLGSILRIDVDADQEPYGVPADNPFVGELGVKSEIWAYGVRNPWKFSFAPDGRMVVADVGQDQYEELSIASAGANLGWSLREASHCFPITPGQDCEPDSTVMPFHEYDHDAGRSITGGYVYTGSGVPGLTGKYVFADFATGRMWAMALPDGRGNAGELHRLGRTGMLVSTFGVDAQGRLFVADYGTGQLWMVTRPADEMAPPSP